MIVTTATTARRKRPSRWPDVREGTVVRREVCTVLLLRLRKVRATAAEAPLPELWEVPHVCLPIPAALLLRLQSVRPRRADGEHPRRTCGRGPWFLGRRAADRSYDALECRPSPWEPDRSRDDQCDRPPPRHCVPSPRRIAAERRRAAINQHRRPNGLAHLVPRAPSPWNRR